MGEAPDPREQEDYRALVRLSGTTESTSSCHGQCDQHENVQCDGTCHDIPDEDWNCEKCGILELEKMCDDCRFYAASD